MTEQNPYGDQPAETPQWQAPEEATPTAATPPFGAPTPHTVEAPSTATGPEPTIAFQPTEHTVPLPPYEQPIAPPMAAPAPKRSVGLAASVLAGALVLGGAAGVGGAAWYDAWQGTDAAPAATATTTSSSYNSTVANLTPGSVESVAAKVLPSVVKINVASSRESGSGSGIVLDDQGHILTNNHVVTIGRDQTITVNFNDGTTVKATVVGTDPVTDLAIIKVDPPAGIVPATIGSSADLRVGQDVVAVGSPFGLNATVTSGIVSALNRAVSVPKATVPDEQENDFGFGFGLGQGSQLQSTADDTTYPAIQTDAAINPGNSGGALVNLAGQVVGINSSIRTSGTESAGSIGLGFAIPIDQAMPIAHQLISGETPTHARLAIRVSPITNDALAHGAVVADVESGGPADKAGLRKGDIITKVDDEVIDSPESLIATIRGHRPDDHVTLTVLRDGKTETVSAVLGSDADATQN